MSTTSRAATIVTALGVGLMGLAAAISIPGSMPLGSGQALGQEWPSGARTPLPEESSWAVSTAMPAAADGAAHHTSTASTVEDETEVPANDATAEAATATSATEVTSSDNPWAGPEIAPSAALRLRVPSIGVDAPVVPVDSTPTGARNPWGGEIFQAIDFPVDGQVRQWVRRGDPNSLAETQARTDPKAFDRVVLYGHASDIGNRLIFQDLSTVRPGDEIVVDTERGSFTYRVRQVLTRAKANLDSLPELYDYPTRGVKEIALVACLPDTTSNVVALGDLVASRSVGVTRSTNVTLHTPAD